MKKKNIIIIGGGSSIGKAILEKIDLSNHNLIIITSKKNLKFENKNIRVISSDLLDESDIEIAVIEILKNFKKIDILFFNGRGGLGIHDSFLSFSLLKKLLWYNFGIFQEFVNQLSGSFKSDSRIICIGSVAAKQITASIGYTIAKSSLENYVRLISKVLIPKNIHIVCLSLGAFWVEQNAMDRLKKNKPKIYEKYIYEKLPRKKMGQISEIIPMIKFLFFEDVSMLSGTIIPMDGGEKTTL